MNKNFLLLVTFKAVLIALPLSLFAKTIAAKEQPSACQMKVERVVRSILIADDREEVTLCRDTLMDLCLYVRPGDDERTYFAKYTYGSSSYPNIRNFQVKLDGYCQIEQIIIDEE